jgi:hypothetical protein
MKIEKVKTFSYSKKMVDMLAVAIKKAVEEVNCDPRCIDWLSYHPDFYRQQPNKKAA